MGILRFMLVIGECGRMLNCLESLVQKYSNHAHQINQIHSLLITTGWLVSQISTSTNSATFVYNTLIRAHLLLHKDPGRAVLHLYTQMLFSKTPPNSHTFPSLIKAATYLQSPVTGCVILAQIVRRGLVLDDFINSCAIKFYAEVGDLHGARKMFDEMPRPDIVSCNSMLDAHCRNGDLSFALQFFEELYCRDVVSWTTLINGFSRSRHFREAIQLFREMVQEEEDQMVKPNEATFVSVLSACANSDGVGALYQGREIHGCIVRRDIRLTAFLGTALIDMYGKRGCIHCAENVFRAVMKKNEVCTWNAMILALACNGREAEALDMFGKMRKTGGFRPNGITFAVILAACARAGMVDSGLRLFESMSGEFGLVPTMEHYGCVVDLLGRTGLLAEAVKFIRRMPIEPDASVLGALLGGCKVHGDVELAADVGKVILALQPGHSGRYTVLSNIYAGAGMWGAAKELREAMEKAGIKKTAGYSWVDSAAIKVPASVHVNHP